MATIKIPYYYTSFKDSRLATWADKKVQQSNDLLLFTWFLEFIPLGMIIFSLAPDKAVNPSIYSICTFLLVLCALVLPFVSFIIFKHMWDKKLLAHKLAACDIRRRSDPVLNRKFRIWMTVIIAVLILIPVMGGICTLAIIE